ncbi:MAG: mitochondrial protein required for respiration [Lentinula lateritia]|uniref:SURF1-like protein n=1 Tax=Lentinula lateritia TaxID=40482 RepID=A0ABQ8V4W3_9AGAR|nr:MAG: mitochondrial protein required for respiration [Lentinula lateritia]KAJ4472663.1 mitochondrial protein required for respiration [Lentinula lateritia]
MIRFLSTRPIHSNVFHFRAPKTTFRLLHDKANVPSIYKPRKERFITPTMVLLGIIPVFTFALGTWQIQRLKWKVNLIDELEEKLQLVPLTLPRRINLSVIPEFVFRKVLIRGKWDHEHTMLLTPRVREGVHGAHVVTPLIRENGTTILVDRGFVSNDYVDDFSFTKEDGEVEVLGMLRTAQIRNSFTPDNLPEERKWYWTDVDGMAAYAGGDEANVQPVFVERIFQGHAGDADYCVSRGIPVGRAAAVDMRNAHLSYVITWFGLSALTSFMFVRVLINKSKMRGRRLPRFS